MEQFFDLIRASVANSLNSLWYILPEFILAAGFVLMIIADVFWGKRYKNIAPILALIVLAFTLVFVLDQFVLISESPKDLFSGMIKLDRLSAWFKLLFNFSSVIIVLFSFRDFQLRNNEKGWGEYYALLIAINLGMHFMAMSGNLLMIYLSVEFVSVCSYIMAAFLTGSQRSEESGMKYALFGAVASAVMLYGMSLLYGFTGTLDVFNDTFFVGLASAGILSATVAVLMTLAGLAFKVSMFPMHAWVPDVYEGAPTPVTAFLSVAPKAAGFALLLRFIASLSTEFSVLSLENGIAVLAIITMTLGNFAALWQTNIKRLMAYSAIGQSGFLLMGIAAYSLTGQASILFYLFAYAIANLGVFLVIGYFSNTFHSEEIDDYKGMGMKYPVASACMVVFLVSLVGIPPTAGFLSKFFIFSATAESYVLGGNIMLLIMLVAAVINTVVSLFYYFKIPQHLYLRKAKTEIVLDKGNLLFLVIIIVMALLTLFLGVFPNELMGMMQL
ncbi:NADH-quinone oxidoreductase subunit N [Solitalea koreensis]|uniref:NADH-quinone oxidoreductase subunit N n=1 Tax=Solitalea koreensis TaxID=543615 RepID=A0A521D0W0_9SPHI|nr:NADH-quinone oxidoreductase subunit N [Solitalea koreensis]SMO65329.1 NADH dehydrogenase subunit N [Solitalea koreensis]